MIVVVTYYIVSYLGLIKRERYRDMTQSIGIDIGSNIFFIRYYYWVLQYFFI